MGIRESMQRKPWLGWVFALLLLTVALYLQLGRRGNLDPYNPDRMKEMVTVKYTDTGDTEEIPRGRLEKMLRDQGGSLDPAKGLINPKTGQPTGFIFDKDDWDETIQRINAERAQAGGAQPPIPRPSPAPPPPPR